MAAFVLALYNTPADAVAFDAYYYGTHVPIAKAVPGLKSYTVSKGPVAAADGSGTYYLIAQLEFASMAELQAGMGSSEGQAAASDTANFAQAGITLLMYESALI